MPSFNASNYQGAVTSLANRLESKNVEFTVKYKKASFTSIATIAAADTINLCIIPAGCRVIPELSYVRRSAATATTALTVDIGITGAVGLDVDRYADALVLTTAGTSVFTTPAIPDGAKNPYTLTVDTVIVATVTVATDPLADAKIEFLIAYEDLSS